MPVLVPGPTVWISWPRYRDAIAVHSGSSWGTVEETIEESISSNDSPRRPSRLRSAAPSWSAVDWRTVANRQCSSSSSPRNVPKWVWVFPTSTTSSIGDHYARRRMAAGIHPRLYVLPGSHPCAAVEAALELKSIGFDRVDLLPMTQLL